MNKKPTLLIALAMTLIFGLQVHSQQGENKEKIKSLKIAFFTERLGLSSDEAAVFWPMYNAYEAEKEALRDAKWKEVYSRIEAGNYSEQEARNILNRYLELEELEEELDKKFNLELAQKFSATRTLLLFQAEHRFRKRLLSEFRKRSGNEP
ncbi:hypothetical protein [Robiginitalea sp. SC105]|uniref:hypothetical protein n=1 Tax=Robiginitalea sp. SC105 TaxID=2762332 RepID=UPI001639AD7F|nr:hypothetical protein [Robiginitalea sp. SC105]MBC2839428.1 hypothetical protein [Robiginitalea sp. SC105]